MDCFEDIQDFNLLKLEDDKIKILKFGDEEIIINKVFNIKRENIVVFGTRKIDNKPVVIKYITRENKENKENRGDEEVKALKEYSYHPNIVLLLNSSKKNDRNIILLERGSEINKSFLKSYKNIQPGDDSNHLLKSIFCQYVVFLSFGHFVKRFQRDVKPGNTILFPSIFLDQMPYLKVIDFELSSSGTLSESKLYPDRARGTKFYDLLEDKLHHLHLAETYFLCSAFSDVELLEEKGFTVEKGNVEVKEIADLLEHKGVTLSEVFKSNFIQKRKIHFYNFLLGDNSHQFIEVKDITNKIKDFTYSNIYIRYLSTPHIFQYSDNSYNSYLFPYYSISSVYILPTEISEEDYLNENLKDILGEINYNFEILLKQLNESGTYSYSNDYLERCEKKISLAGKDKSSKDLLDNFNSEMKNYQEALTKNGYYTKIEEFKIKKFGFGDIDEKNNL
ncbi:hypothetical protein DICPUDRAFT_84604 [Dictyostelium purpureum]|uniref:Protein kinase domain-containing protein n=1 Tax=Dictyostelium purpureum TaxID=5786 RepID=F1A368_DICPU|nr:uncharacterized protein DICPUDRAFT_84604 [Dictyostelium purpureum]EGC29363.1 hypothetical protein DICPUDRAFT_84604 [Dictyostelium purpureum]|eukprot:XP_003294107.1 hypothetical protein DICPUDRAFT_84604 [Dictyostelium purpureum]